jgi:hypothetical protein
MVHLLFKSGFFLIPVLAIIQTISPALPGSEYFVQVERMGLIGVLFLICWVLARKLDQFMTKHDVLLEGKDKQREIEIARKEAQLAVKDEHLLEMTKQMNQSLTLQIESNRRVEAVLADSTKAKIDLSRTNEAVVRAVERLTERIERLEQEGERR